MSDDLVKPWRVNGLVKDNPSARIEELEAKLARAVGALDRIQDGSYGKNAAIARATLEELKEGEKQ